MMTWKRAPLKRRQRTKAHVRAWPPMAMAEAAA
jgi:hypothetical protein